MDALLEWLFAKQRFGLNPGLTRVRALLGELGNPQEGLEVVLVGGTNGKGSTAATLADILTHAGRRTGLFTSPHLTHFSERFVLDGEQIEEESTLTTLAEIRPAAEDTGATFFEITTALGTLLFARAGAEVAVMEVGLGGRFDATNVLEPVLSIVTGISRDHTHILGSTSAEIAREKAGIMRSGRRCLTGARGEALATLREEAARVGAELWAVGEEIGLEAESLGWEGLRLEVKSPLGSLAVHSPLLGEHQARNVALAVVAAQVLGVDGAAIRDGVAATRWPGRLEPLRYKERTFLLDGAHNPEAAGALARAVTGLGIGRAVLVFGIMANKEIAEVVAALSATAREVILTRSRLSPRAASPEALRGGWSVPTHLTYAPEEAVTLAVERTLPGEVILVAGSLYLVGEVRPLLLGQGSEPWERWQ